MRVHSFYAAILAVAHGLNVPGVAIHDFWEESDQARRGEELWGEDGVHPTDLGHELMAQGLLAALDDQENNGGDAP